LNLGPNTVIQPLNYWFHWVKTSMYFLTAKKRHEYSYLDPTFCTVAVKTTYIKALAHFKGLWVTSGIRRKRPISFPIFDQSAISVYRL